MPRAKNETAKVIFKNSRNTVNTYSRTYSGASQIYTKSLILQLKKNRPKANFYEQKGTVKRDLSIETDICILRSYYKKRRHKLINREAVSNKSKYSGNRTEIDTIDEFKYDSSACGDSKGSIKLKNTHFNVNLTALVIQNLKKLLNYWVKKYLLDNDDTKQKIETVLDSILHKLDLQTKNTASTCTYTVDIEIMDDKQKQKPVISRTINSRVASATQGSQSVPVSGKCLRILSTLSVPKNIHRQKSSFSWTKLNKIRNQKILLSSNGSSKYLFTSSSLNFLSIPTNLFTKQCATYQQDVNEKKVKQESIAFPEELFGGEISNSLATIRKINTLNNANNATNSALNTIPSIYRNIYNDLGSYKIHSLSEDGRSNIQKQQNNDVIVTVDKNHEDLKIQDVIKDKAKQISRVSKKNKLRLRKQKIIKSKQFTYSVRKSKNHKQKEKELLYHFQSIFEMISSQKCSEDVKLDIHINVFPSMPSKTGKVGTNMCEYSYPPISGNFTATAEHNCVNQDSVTHQQNIIPLLDGAASHAKYMISGETFENSSEINNNAHNPVVDDITKESQIAQEISELKMIIKSLANTTEKLVKDHLQKKIFGTHAKLYTNEKKYQSTEARPSIGVQISSKYVKENLIGSGIKLKKDPKKKNREYNPRLMKKSTSYNVIDSESILKVTDMTSAGQGQASGRSKEDKALTCSLPKTKSLYEVSLDANDEKVLAFRYDDLSKPRQCVYNVFEHKHQSIPIKDDIESLKLKFSKTKAICEQKPDCNKILPKQAIIKMETDVAKIKQDEINTYCSLENLNTSVSLEMALNSFYNVTPIESQITNFEENSQTQSSTTLTDGIIINNSISTSGCSVNIRMNNTENNVTHSVSSSEFLKGLVENIYNNTLISAPQILFNAPKHKIYKKLHRKLSKSTNRKSHKLALLVRHYIGHYKYKHPEKIIPRKYKTYFDKTRRNPAHSSRIQQNLFSNSAIKAVSRSTILKKVLAKENLFSEADEIVYNDNQQDKVLTKDASEDTLTRINSESSHNDSTHTKTPPSVVEILNNTSATEAASTPTIILTQNETAQLYNQSHETYYDNEYGEYLINNNTKESINRSDFKTEIEVALALNDASIFKYITNTNIEQSQEKMLYKENLTSAESFMSESDIINFTSSQDSSETDTQNMILSKNKDDKMCIVINEMVNTFNNISDSDTFVIAQTSSYFKNTSESKDISSEQTLTPSSELTNQTEPCNIYCQPTSKGEVKTALLNTMTNEKMYQMPVSCSSNDFSSDNFNGVIVANELRRIPLLNTESTADKNMRNVIQKSFSVDNDGDRPKNMKLPNEDTIKSILEAEVEKKTCSEEFRNFIPQTDVLDKLISFLDIAIKRMEDSLLKKIGNEIKNTLDKFEKFLPLTEERDFLKSDLKFHNRSDLSTMEFGGITVLEEGVQCTLVRNEIIDELTKIKVEGEANVECPLQMVKSKIRNYKDSFEILKSVELPVSVGEQGDSYITSSTEGVTVKRLSKKSSLLSYLAAPIHFIRTNILVLISVPVFFMSIFLLYSFFLLLV